MRERRRRAGLSLRAVARVAGTSESNVSAYERGAKRPNDETLSRVLAAIEATARSPIYRRNLVTVPAAAAAVRAGLRAGASTAELLRVIREMRSNARDVVSLADRGLFFVEPSTTGDQRWDALLAGAVEDLALRAGDVPPAWTRGHALSTFWFVGDMPSMRAYAFAHTPLSMQVRGVMIDPADLEAV